MKLQKIAFISQVERYEKIIDLHPFTYTHFSKVKPTTFIHAVCPLVHESNSVMFHNELYQEFTYDTCGIPKPYFVGKVEIPVLLDNGCTFSSLTNHFYATNGILCRYLKIPEDYIIFCTRNAGTKVNF